MERKVGRGKENEGKRREGRRERKEGMEGTREREGV